jgi:PEP-CTERM motif
MRSKISLLLAFVLVLAVAAFANPGPTYTVYFDYNQWMAATTGWSHYPFLPGEVQNPGTSVITSAGSFGPGRGVFPNTMNVWNDRVTQAGGEATTWWITGLDMQAFGGYWDFSPGGWGQGLTLTVDLIPMGSSHVADICGDVVNGCGGGQGQSFLVPDGTWFGVVISEPVYAFSITADHTPGVAETFDLAGLDLARVPEPGTLVLLGTGILGLAGAVRRKLLL